MFAYNMNMYMCIYEYMWTSTYMHVCTCIMCIRTRIHIYIDYLGVYMYRRICIAVCSYLYIYMYLYAHMLLYLYMRTASWPPFQSVALIQGLLQGVCQSAADHRDLVGSGFHVQTDSYFGCRVHEYLKPYAEIGVDVKSWMSHSIKEPGLQYLPRPQTFDRYCIGIKESQTVLLSPLSIMLWLRYVSCVWHAKACCSQDKLMLKAQATKRPC